MTPSADLETHLEAAVRWLKPACAEPNGPSLSEAAHYALFPAGARVRPLLTLTLADALGVRAEALPAATAIELLHNASLVHDDMPCFDDAERRRGKPSVQKRYGEAMALLVGDVLLSLAFREVALIEDARLRQLTADTACLLIRGQAMELDGSASLEAYHGHKTACLFSLAAQAPAMLAGQPTEPFAALGDAIGRSYQVADDLFDQASPQPGDSKPRGRDLVHRRPNASVIMGRTAAEAAFLSSLSAIRHQVDGLPHANRSVEAFVDSLMTRFAHLALPPSASSVHARRQWQSAHQLALGVQ